MIEDIEDVLVNGAEISDEQYAEFGRRVADALRHSLDRTPREGTLRMSNIGKPCLRQLWYEVNSKEEQEEMRGPTYMKFLIGHLIEEVALFLAEVSGHKVEGRQDEAEIEGILGHRDAVIDGTLVDVKSASTYSFQKFESGRLEEDDAFGYVDQIQSYLHHAQEDPIVTDKDRAAFFVIDKTLGNMCLDFHKRREFPPIPEIFKYRKKIVEQDEPPARTFDPIPEGKSGNMKLGINCSYCPFKKTCWPEARTFLYSNRPVTLVKVVREPNVPEITD